MKKFLIVILFLAAGIGVGLWIFGIPNNNPKQEIVFPSATPTLPQIKDQEVTSIDGKMKLIMRAQPQADQSVSYSFVISDGEQEEVFFTKVATSDAIILPHNSWSPDSHHIFFIETAASTPQVLVFNASGEAFADGPYLNVTTLFEQKQTPYTLVQATGWDSRGLLHIRTKKEDNTKGPSYWFDVASRSFIQLAAR